MAGMDRYECRKSILAELDKLGLLVKLEDHQHSVGHCQRCDSVVEPYLRTVVRQDEAAGEPRSRQFKTGAYDLSPNALQRSTPTGWKAFMIGVFPGSFGGRTAYRYGTAVIALK